MVVFSNRLLCVFLQSVLRMKFHLNPGRVRDRSKYRVLRIARSAAAETPKIINYEQEESCFLYAGLQTQFF